MKKTFVSLLIDFIDANGKKILDQPDRFKSLFLDFSQNEYRAETQIFSQFLASNQAKELKNSDDVDTDFLKGVAERFQQTYLFDKNSCEMVIASCAFSLGLIDKKTFSAGLNRESGGNTPEVGRMEISRMETGDAVFQANSSSENSIKCYKCDNTIQVIFKYCPYCGSNQFDPQ